jgi:hypothetical protein
VSSVKLEIAEFIVELHSQYSINLEQGFIPFAIDSSEKSADVLLDCHLFDQLHEPETKTEVFDSADNNCRFFKIYKTADSLYFEIFDQENNSQIQQIGILSADFRHWDVYCRADGDGGITPLRYPLAPIIMQYLALQHDAIMIHSSCVTDGVTGRLFSGFSGVGKSTMAGIWNKQGYTVVNDDRLLVRLQNGKIVAYNTPMYYADRPKKALLNEIFLISHAPQNRKQQISGSAAVSKVMAFCIQNNFEPVFIEHNIDVISKICSSVKVFTLGFVPDNDIVDFIINN